MAQPAAPAEISDADRAIARDLTIKGFQALAQQDFKRAEEDLEKAITILWAPTIGLGLARARVGLGKWVSAKEAYYRVANTKLPSDASDAFKAAVANAAVEVKALEPRVPTVVITVKGPSAPDVTFDATPVLRVSLGMPRPADPGQHVIRASAQGFVTQEVTVTLAERAKETVTIELKSGEGEVVQAGLPPKSGAAPVPGPDVTQPPAAPSRSSWSTQKTLAVGTTGLGALGFALTGVFAAQAASKNSDSKKDCSPTDPNFCSDAGVAARNDAKSAAGIATGTLVAGSVLAAAGITLWLTAPSSPAGGEVRGRVEIVPMPFGADMGIGFRGAW